MKKVVLFEDNPDMVSLIGEPLNSLLTSNGFELFVPSKRELEESFQNAEETYENSLIKFLDNISDVVFVVADRDLSRLLGGFSESSVSRVCEIKKIPFALYARVNRDDGTAESLFRAENKLDYQSEFKLVLNAKDNLNEPKIHRFCEQINDLVTGFENIREFYSKSIDLDDEVDSSGFFSSISHIIDNPLIEFKLKRFSLGNSSILPYNILDKKKIEQFNNKELAEKKKRIVDSLVYLTGYWLHETLLKYPGLIANKVATASYLGVSASTFEDLQKKGVLDGARYQGPFSSYRNYWFIDKLDDLMFKEDCSDGAKLAEKYDVHVEVAKCSVCKTEGAGFYCILTEAPVCKSCSVGNISWIPSGANLCRINKNDYDTYGPWAGW